MRRFVFCCLLLLFSTQCFSQVVLNGNTFPNVGLLNDAYHFSYDSNPSGPGGVNTILKVGNRWYWATLVTWPSYGWRMLAYTDDEYCSIYPPSNVAWQTFFATGPGPSGLAWSNYPSAYGSFPTGTVQNLVLTGEVITVFNSSTVVQPDYIDLPNKSTYPAKVAGRLIYDVCNTTMSLSDGFTWNPIWPLKTNYIINDKQAFEFINEDQRIEASNTAPPSNSPSPVMKFIGSEGENMVLGMSPYNTGYNSSVNFTSSVGATTRFAQSPYTIGDNDYLVYNSINANTITLPSAPQVNGRILIIVNTSSTTITLVGSINGLSSGQLGAKEAIKVVAVNSEWYKID